MTERPIGICPLCGLEKTIHESHFIPNALYPDAIELEYATPASSGTGGPQAKKHLLCGDCEHLFNRNGESEVLWHIAPKTQKKFPLHDLLKQSSPREITPAYLRFSGKDIGVKMDHFAYFALSLVWRGAITSWPMPDGNYTTPIRLGNYQEPIRRFLAGETPLPPDIFVIVCVCIDQESQSVWYEPAPVQGVPYTAFGFLMRGVYFRVHLGSDTPKDIQNRNCAGPFKAIHAIHFERDTLETHARLKETQRRARSTSSVPLAIT